MAVRTKTGRRKRNNSGYQSNRERGGYAFLALDLLCGDARSYLCADDDKADMLEKFRLADVDLTSDDPRNYVREKHECEEGSDKGEVSAHWSLFEERRVEFERWKQTSGRGSPREEPTPNISGRKVYDAVLERMEYAVLALNFLCENASYFCANDDKARMLALFRLAEGDLRKGDQRSYVSEKFQPGYVKRTGEVPTHKLLFDERKGEFARLKHSYEEGKAASEHPRHSSDRDSDAPVGLAKAAAEARDFEGVRGDEVPSPGSPSNFLHPQEPQDFAVALEDDTGLLPGIAAFPNVPATLGADNSVPSSADGEMVLQDSRSITAPSLRTFSPGTGDLEMMSTGFISEAHRDFGGVQNKPFVGDVSKENAMFPSRAFADARSSASEDALPSGSHAVKDPEGRLFYHGKDKHTSQWLHPSNITNALPLHVHIPQEYRFKWADNDQEYAQAGDTFLESFTIAYRELSKHELGIDDTSNTRLFLEDTLKEELELVYRDPENIRWLIVKADTQVVGLLILDLTEYEDQGRVYGRQMVITPSLFHKQVGKTMAQAVRQILPNMKTFTAINRRKNRRSIEFFKSQGLKESSFTHGNYDPSKYVGFELSPLLVSIEESELKWPMALIGSVQEESHSSAEIYFHSNLMTHRKKLETFRVD